MLMWIYFSSAVLLFSASCARALQELGAPRRARERALKAGAQAPAAR